MVPGGNRLLAVVVVALAVHGVGIGGGYVLDDGAAILRHPAVNGSLPLHEVFSREWFGRPFGVDGWSSSYRPITSLGFAVEHRITEAAWLHHAINVLSYAALCAGVFLLARRWVRPNAALAAAILFAVWPVHVESVASIVGRADIWAALACLTAFGLVDGEQPPSVRAIAGAVALYATALLCKESVALFPGLVGWFAALRWRATGLRRRGALGVWAWARAPVALGAAGLIYISIRNSFMPVGLPPDFVGADNVLHGTSGGVRWWGNLAVLGHYTEITVIPTRLCADHTYADVVPPATLFGAGAVRAWVGLGVAVAMLADGVRAWRGRSRGLLFGTGLAYVLAGQWVIDLSVIVAERLALWPTVWLALALGALIEAVVRPERRRLFAALGISIAAAYAARSIDRTLDWQNRVSLYESSVEACPAAVHNRLNLAHTLAEEGRTREAVWHFAVAGATRSAYPEPVNLPAFEAEWEEPLDTRLQNLPALVEAKDPRLFWIGLHRFLVSGGYAAEANEVARIAGGAR